MTRCRRARVHLRWLTCGTALVVALVHERAHAGPALSPPKAASPAPPKATAPASPASPRNRPKETLSLFYRSDRGPKKPSPPATRPGIFSPKRPAPPPPNRVAVTAEYRENVRHWHETSDHEAPKGPNGFACLVLVNLNSKERAELCPLSSSGTFDAASRERAAVLFREQGSDNAHAVSPRLLDVLYNIQEHFHAGEVRLLSGYRSPWEGNSNHGKGRAADIVVPGTTDDATASHARSLGYIGVGIYPTSHFVHVDVREASYFWVDASAPGRPHRERGILANVAKDSDAKALERGVRRTFGPSIGHDAAAWLAARKPAPSAVDAASASDDPPGEELPVGPAEDSESSEDGRD